MSGELNHLRLSIGVAPRLPALKLSADALLIFDIGNVLVDLDNDLLAQQIASCCRHREMACEMLSHLLARTAISSGEVTVEDLYESLCRDYGFTGDLKKFEKTWCSHFKPVPEMEALAAALSLRYRLVAFSNSNRLHWQHLRSNFVALRIPHALYASHEIGFAKPRPEAFRVVLAAEQANPGGVVFVDDTPANIEAASLMGLHAVQFSGRGPLESALRSLGLSW